MGRGGGGEEEGVPTGNRGKRPEAWRTFVDFCGIERDP